MGKVEKVIVLSVLFLVALILVVTVTVDDPLDKTNVVEAGGKKAAPLVARGPAAPRRTSRRSSTRRSRRSRSRPRKFRRGRKPGFNFPCRRRPSSRTLHRSNRPRRRLPSPPCRRCRPVRS